MSDFDGAVKAAGWNALGTWIERGLSTVVFLILANLLTPEEFGVVAFASAIVFILTMLQNGGLPEALVQRKEITERHISSAFTVNLIISVVLAGALVAAAGPIGRAFGQEAVIPVIRLLALNLVLGAFVAVPVAILRRTLDFRSLAIRNMLTRLVAGPAAITIALLGGGVYALVVQSLVNSVVGIIVFWRAIPVRPHLEIDRGALKDLVGFGSLQLGTQLLYTARTRTDNLIVGGVLGATVLGYYNVSYRVLELVNTLLTRVVADLMMPLLARLQEDRERHLRASIDMAGVAASIAAPAFLGIVATAPDIILGLLGEQWQPAIPVVRALALLGLVEVLGHPARASLLSIGGAGPVFGLTLVETVGSLAVFIVAVQSGIETLAWSYAAFMLLLFPVNVYVTTSRIGLPVWAYLRSQFRPAIAAGIMCGLLLLLRGQLLDLATLVRLGLELVAGVVLYAAALWVVDRPGARRLLRIVRSLLSRVRGERSSDGAPASSPDDLV